MKYPQDPDKSKIENIGPKLKTLVGIIPEIKLEDEKEAIRNAIVEKIST